MNNRIATENINFIKEDNKYLDRDIKDGSIEKEQQEIMSFVKTERIVELKEIYSNLKNSSPTPLGMLKIVDSRITSNEFTIAWKINGLGIDVNNVKEVVIDLAFIPTTKTPVLNFAIGVDDGGDGLVFSDYAISINKPEFRTIVHDLMVCKNLHFLFFDEDSMLDFNMPIDVERQNKFLNEVKACYSSFKDYKEDMFHESNWIESIHEMADSIRAGGQPINEKAYDLYKNRLKYNPQPDVNQWNLYKE